MTPAEKAEHQRRINADKQHRYKKRFRALPKDQRVARRQADGAVLYDWSRILPHVDKQPSGCWLWTGPFKVYFTRLRPVATAGAFGREYVDHIVCCLHRGRPPPNCFLSRVCDTIGCVAPEHLVWSNRAVETAKRRQKNVQEELARRIER